MEPVEEKQKPVALKDMEARIPHDALIFSLVLCLVMPFVFHSLCVGVSRRFGSSPTEYSWVAILLSSIVCIVSLFYLYVNIDVRPKK